MPKASRPGNFRRVAAADIVRKAASDLAKKTAAKHEKKESSKKNDEGIITAKVDAQVSTVPTTTTDATLGDKSHGEDVGSNDPATTNQQHLSRGQRKRMAKRAQYLKREQMILSSLKLQRQEDQKKRIDGLDAIKDALLATVSKKPKTGETGESKPENLLKDNKSRQLLLARETAQMSLVLEHPSFQADPFATIRQHLENTLASGAEDRKHEKEQHLKERREKEEEKKAHKREMGIKKKKKNRSRPTRSRGK